ncbi:MAG: hypothetical protein GX751_06775 [Desulfuromonadaceae bacterium]|nr:hypothetical protein [Desulfuromonadaceae bacterium]
MYPAEESLFCIRISAKKNGHHILGYDRLGTYEEIKPITQEMIGKTLSSGQGPTDEMSINVEALKHYSLMTARFPDFITIPVNDYRGGRKYIKRVLTDSGVSRTAIEHGFYLLTQTYGKGGLSLAGAVVLDSFTGQRLDGLENGIWVGRVDLTERLRTEIEKEYEEKISQVKDWLILTAKILAMPGVLAELTMSNDKNYPGGLVSTPEMGAMFFPHLRGNENEVGGRIIFVRSNGFDLEKVKEYLENAVFLIDTMGKIR